MDFMPFFKRLDAFGHFYVIFQKEENICDLLCAFQHIKQFLKLLSSPKIKNRKKLNLTVASPKMYSFDFGLLQLLKKGLKGKNLPWEQI